MLDIKPIAGALGAEIGGIDLTANISPEVFTEIRRLLVEYGVIFFRDQNISHAQQKNIAAYFGPLQTHPAMKPLQAFRKSQYWKALPKSRQK